MSNGIKPVSKYVNVHQKLSHSELRSMRTLTNYRILNFIFCLIQEIRNKVRF